MDLERIYLETLRPQRASLVQEVKTLQQSFYLLFNQLSRSSTIGSLLYHIKIRVHFNKSKLFSELYKLVGECFGLITIAYFLRLGRVRRRIYTIENVRIATSEPYISKTFGQAINSLEFRIVSGEIPNFILTDSIRRLGFVLIPYSYIQHSRVFYQRQLRKRPQSTLKFIFGVGLGFGYSKGKKKKEKFFFFSFQLWFWLWLWLLLLCNLVLFRQFLLPRVIVRGREQGQLLDYITGRYRASYIGIK